MSKLETFMNQLTDMDWGWWPFVSLRPRRDQLMNNNLLVQMSFIYGTLIAFAELVILLVNYSDYLSLGVFAVCLISGWVFFFLAYKFTFAYFWNLRARRLQFEKK